MSVSKLPCCLLYGFYRSENHNGLDTFAAQTDQLRFSSGFPAQDLPETPESATILIKLSYNMTVNLYYVYTVSDDMKLIEAAFVNQVRSSPQLEQQLYLLRL